MKRTILVIAAAATFMLIGTQAFACYWDGYWTGPKGEPMNGFYNDVYTSGNYQDFFSKTAQLRKDLAAKQDEYDALMATHNPDTKKVNQLNRDITAINEQLSAKARSYRLPVPSSYQYCGYRHGNMNGYGYNCW